MLLTVKQCMEDLQTIKIDAELIPETEALVAQITTHKDTVSAIQSQLGEYINQTSYLQTLALSKQQDVKQLKRTLHSLRQEL